MAASVWLNEFPGLDMWDSSETSDMVVRMIKAAATRVLAIKRWPALCAETGDKTMVSDITAFLLAARGIASLASR